MIVVGGWPGRIVVGLNGRFGVRPADFAALGDFPSPFADDADPGDETTEFVGVVQTLPASGTVTFTDQGGFSHTGAADGTYTTTFRLYTWAQGGPITEHTPDEILTTSFGAVPGVTLTAAAALIAGSAFGPSGATAGGATLVAAASLLAGAGAGGGASAAPGATLTAGASLIAGVASGPVSANAPGATLVAGISGVWGGASGPVVAPPYLPQPTTAASWSYLQTATLWRLVATDSWGGQVTHERAGLFLCDYAEEQRRMVSARGDEFTSRLLLYTSLPGIKQGDMVLIGASALDDPFAAGALEVRAIATWADTFSAEGPPDFRIAT